jgi:hypothetical protein
MSNKTISINPSLFSLGGSKTKKNKDKKTKPTAVPLISPSVLKNKLLKRIKEHKQKETQDLENNKRKLSKNEEVPLKQKNDMLNYTDEFTDSINYLQTLSKQRQKEELERKTIRNYHSIGEESLTQGQVPIINIDLPEELVEPVIPISTETFHIKPKDDVPYGVLKGGTKPSYREWSKTQRNTIVTNPNNSLVIQGGNLSSQKTARENRLNLLKLKIKNKTEEKLKDAIVNQNLIKKPFETPKNDLQLVVAPPTVLQPTVLQANNSSQIKQQPYEEIIATKYITKKTIKRKYTLGRSKIKKSVSVLIKDRGTRKKILNAQKELKRKNINDIKTYLREHNLIKIGSNAPNDVLRKIYESAMLSGEITNSNSDVLLHNFSKEDKEL